MPRNSSKVNRLARSTWTVTDKAATGLFRWLTTDHTGFKESMDRMPHMGFLDSIKHTLMHFMISIIGAVLTGLWVYALIAYGMPYLFSVTF